MYMVWTPDADSMSALKSYDYFEFIDTNIKQLQYEQFVFKIGSVEFSYWRKPASLLSLYINIW